MENEKLEEAKRSNTSLLLIAMIIIVLVVGGISVSISKNKKASDDTPKKENENVTDKKEYKSAFNLDEITILVKDYYYEKDLVKASNLKTWNISSSEYLRHNEESNTDVYKVEGTYSCNDKKGTCVYLEQLLDNKGDIFDYLAYVEVENKDGKMSIKSISQALIDVQAVEVNQKLDNDQAEDEVITTLVKNHYKENNLYTESNTKEWKFNNVEYMRKLGNTYVYEVSGTVTCVDESLSCVYIEQILDDQKEDGTYDFKFYVEVNSDKTSIKSIYSLFLEYNTTVSTMPASTIPSSKELPKDEIISMTKASAATLNDTDDIASWNITDVSLVGSSLGVDEKIYKLEGTYTCKSGKSTCVYMEQMVDEPNGNEYKYVNYVTIKDKKIISQSSSYAFGDLIN